MTVNEMMSDMDYEARRTESMDKLSAAITSCIDSAVQVNDALQDVTSRASQLDSRSRDLLDVIGDTSRLADVLDALCARQPRYARFLWIAARNLVRDVIGHVTSADFHPQVKVTGDANDFDNGQKQRRRAAAELDLFYGRSAHLDCKTARYERRFAIVT